MMEKISTNISIKITDECGDIVEKADTSMNDSSRKIFERMIHFCSCFLSPNSRLRLLLEDYFKKN